MNELMYKYMKVGLVHFMAYPSTIKGEGPILETLKKIAEDSYFNLVEISWIKDPTIRKKVKELLEASNLEIKYGAQPRLLIKGLDLNSPIEQERRKALEEIKEGIDEAIELGATALALLSGKCPSADKIDNAKELLVDSLRRLCEYANTRKKNFPIILEIFDREVDKRRLIGPTQDAKWVAERVGCKNFGLMHDLSHLPLLKETAEEALVPIREHLLHIHLGNCILDKRHPAYGDSHPRFGIEGGANDVEEVVQFLKTLMKIGYLNSKEPRPVSFEVRPLGSECSEVIIANAKRVLNRAWALLEKG